MSVAMISSRRSSLQMSRLLRHIINTNIDVPNCNHLLCFNDFVSVLDSLSQDYHAYVGSFLNNIPLVVLGSVMPQPINVMAEIGNSIVEKGYKKSAAQKTSKYRKVIKYQIGSCEILENASRQDRPHQGRPLARRDQKVSRRCSRSHAREIQCSSTRQV